MKTISTGSATFVTGTAIADAVQQYALALARRGRVDVVDIPVVLSEGERARSAFVIGWLMEATTSTAATGHPELLDSAIVDDLLARVDLLSAPRGEPFSDEDLASDWPDLDLDFAPDREHA